MPNEPLYQFYETLPLPAPLPPACAPPSPLHVRTGPPGQYSTVQYSTVQYSTVPPASPDTTGHSGQYSTVQYSTVQYSTVQFSTVQCQCSTVWIIHKDGQMGLQTKYPQCTLPNWPKGRGSRPVGNFSLPQHFFEGFFYI